MATWQDVNRQILDGLDLEAEYRSMGLEMSGGPSSSGWVSCKVFRSDERSPSAGVCVAGEHPQRGRYKEFTGECRNLSFFEFCVVAGRFADWKAARDHYRQQLGIAAPRNKAKPSPDDRLAFRDYNENLVRSWCQTKPPIKAWAVRIAGGRIAGYPPKTNKFTVIALPIFGTHGPDDDPGGWVIWNKSGKPLELYRGKNAPPELLKMINVGGSENGWMNAFGLANVEKAEIVWKVEGPGDMLALQSFIPVEFMHRHVVVTNSCGSKSILSGDHLDMLAGKTVYVLHDADVDGQAGGQKWAEALSHVAAEVRHVRLPYEVVEKGGKDVRDWLNDGHTYDELLDLAAAAEIVRRPGDGQAGQAAGVAGADEVDEAANAGIPKDPLAAERLACANLQLDVLGELGDRKIKVFSEFHGKTVTIDAVNRLSRADMIQICGPPARQFIYDGAANQDAAPGQMHISQVRDAIAMLAGHESAGEGIELGQGVWRGKDDRDKFVLVGPGEAVLVDATGTAAKVCRPRVAGLKLNMDAGRDARWYDFDRLQEYLRLADDPKWRAEQIERACALFDNWFWENQTGVCSELMAGLVMATWVQSVWRWRPLVSITGPSDSGKSTLFELLETIFGPLSLLSSKSTEAGIRQAVANHSKVILCDEFESDKHRKQILEFFRTSSKGSRTLRGTIGQSARGFGLRHICWVTAIEIGLSRAPDKNRFISLELAAPPPEKRGRLKLPPEPEIADLGQRLLGIACRFANAADDAAERLKAISFPGVHGRVVESFSVPVAMLAATMDVSADGAADLMGRIFTQLEQDPSQGTKDEVDLLGEILSSTVQLGHGEQASVAQILSNPNEYSGGAEALERVGVKVAYDRRCEVPKRLGVFFAHQPILRYLLKGTRWADQSIDQLLKRLKGAEKKQLRCGGHKPWGVMLDWEYMCRFLGDHEEQPTPDF